MEKEDRIFLRLTDTVEAAQKFEDFLSSSTIWTPGEEGAEEEATVRNETSLFD